VQTAKEEDRMPSASSIAVIKQGNRFNAANTAAQTISHNEQSANTFKFVDPVKENIKNIYSTSIFAKTRDAGYGGQNIEMSLNQGIEEGTFGDRLNYIQKGYGVSTMQKVAGATAAVAAGPAIASGMSKIPWTPGINLARTRALATGPGRQNLWRGKEIITGATQSLKQKAMQIGSVGADALHAAFYPTFVKGTYEGAEDIYKGKVQKGIEKVAYNTTEMFMPYKEVVKMPVRGYKVLKDLYKGDDVSAGFRLIAGPKAKSVQKSFAQFLRKGDKFLGIGAGTNWAWNAMPESVKGKLHDFYGKMAEEDMQQKREQELKAQ
jgi:hypothetical protein